jgi:hypothetical protein
MHDQTICRLKQYTQRFDSRFVAQKFLGLPARTDLLAFGEEVEGIGVLLNFFRGSNKLSVSLPGRLVLCSGPDSSPKASFLLSVEFHLFLMALSVLRKASDAH